jgi:integrase
MAAHIDGVTTMKMTFSELKLRCYPDIPDREHWPSGLYQRAGGAFYRVLYANGKQTTKGLGGDFWAAAETLARERGELLVEAPAPRLARNGTAVKVDARGRHMPATRRVPEARQRMDISVAAMLGRYEKESHSISDSDIPLVRSIAAELADKPLAEITKSWVVNTWVADMKKRQSKPGTIKKRVESLARAFQWHEEDCASKLAKALGGGSAAEQHAESLMRINPLRNLPKKYYDYSREELKSAGVKSIRNEERDRRLYDDEFATILAVAKGDLLRNNEPFMPFREGDPEVARKTLAVMFQTIVQTAMRLRETYTLRRWQIQLQGAKSQIVLPPEVTKTAAGRTVPVVPELLPVLRDWLASDHVGKGRDAIVFEAFWGGDEDFFALKKTSERMSLCFSRLFDFAGVEKLREHDLRHEGTCRWVERKTPDGMHAYSMAECMKFTGHRGEAVFMRYLSLRGSDAAERLYSPEELKALAA